MWLWSRQRVLGRKSTFPESPDRYRCVRSPVVVVYLAMGVDGVGAQFDNDAYFGRSVVGKTLSTEGDLLGHVTAAVLLIALIALVAISAVRRIVAVGVICGRISHSGSLVSRC